MSHNAPTAPKTNEGQAMARAQSSAEDTAKQAGDQIKDAGQRMMGTDGGQGQQPPAVRRRSSASTRNVPASDRGGQGQGEPLK